MKFSLNDSSEQSAVQREAIAAGMQLLHKQGHARVRFTMACGTGKTFTQLKLAEALMQSWGNGPSRIVVLVPTLALVRQSRDEWAAAQAQGDAYASLCVCSDPSLKTDVLQDQGEDHVELSEEELAELGVESHANALSDVERINHWLDARERDFGSRAVSVIFTTYQSVQVVAMAMEARHPDDRAIHIGIFDEAHKTAGAAGKPFAYALKDANLAIGKRLFFTATERIAATGKSARSGDLEEDGESQFISMNDEAVYGPRAYSLSFSQAAARGIIVPYEIIISVVGDPSIKGQKLAQRSVRSEDGEQHNAIDIANMTALQRVMDNFNLKKAITFHRTVARAKEFAEMRHTVEGARMDGSNGFNRLHVSGRQTPAQRHAQMQQYAHGQGRQVITNARCLTEGINVPATDIVGFMDSRGGTVDIVQAAGRTMRRAPGKMKGYVFLPVHDIEQDFGRVRDVLAALAENDEVLQAEMRRVALESGGGHGSGSSLGALPIQILTDGRGGEVRAEELIRAIRIHLIRMPGLDEGIRIWDKRFGELVEFKREKGNCLVPQNYGNRSLGKWISDQRRRALDGRLSDHKRKLLSDLGVVFGDLVDYRWILNYEKYKGYFFTGKRPQGLKSEDKSVWEWWRRQKSLFINGRLSDEKYSLLKKVGFVGRLRDAMPVSKKLDDLWDENFREMMVFVEKNGRYPKQKESAVGMWLSRQRTLGNRGALSVDRKRRLAEVGILFKGDGAFNRKD